MIQTSCITHPVKNPILTIRAWQLEFCEGDYCAAALLSFFEDWHNCLQSVAAHQAQHLTKNQYPGQIMLTAINFSVADLAAGLLHLYPEHVIFEKLKYLLNKGVLSLADDSNMICSPDEIKPFQFYPEMCNRWLREIYADLPEKDKFPDKFQPIEQSSSMWRQVMNDANIPLNQPAQIQQQSERVGNPVQSIIDALVNKGFSASLFEYPSLVDKIHELCGAGATVDTFLKAYDIADFNAPKRFNVGYVTRIVGQLIHYEIKNN